MANINNYDQVKDFIALLLWDCKKKNSKLQQVTVVCIIYNVTYFDLCTNETNNTVLSSDI